MATVLSWRVVRPAYPTLHGRTMFHDLCVCVFMCADVSLQHPTARVGHGCVIGPHVVLGPGCVVGDGACVWGGAVCACSRRGPGTRRSRLHVSSHIRPCSPCRVQVDQVHAARGRKGREPLPRLQ